MERQKYHRANSANSRRSHCDGRRLPTKLVLHLPPENNEEGPLDFKIEKDELKSASNILKSGKAVGMDNLDNDMIFSLVETHPEIIVKLFNDILRSGTLQQK